MKKTRFEAGKKYYCYSPLNSDRPYEFEVVKRTEKTVTIKNSDGEIKRKKVEIYNDDEIIYPTGKHSMCLVLRSSDEVTATQNVAEETIAAQDVVIESEKSIIPADNVTYVDFQKAEEKTEKSNQKYYEINENMAARAKRAMSFDDYKQGSATQNYRDMVDKAILIAENQKSETDSMYHQKIDYYLDLYARKLADNLNKYYEIGTRCESVLIAGPSNFPVKKKEKQVKAWDSNMHEYREIQKILEKIKGIGKGGISSDDPKAIEKLKEKLICLERNQEHMKQVNAYYRKHNTLEGCPLLSKIEITKLNSNMNKGYRTDKNPYESFWLSNNNVNMRQIKQRIEELEKKDSLKGWTFEAGEIIANKELNRLQILFDEKPDEALRIKLKQNGFKWAPSQNAWQRLLNKNAVYAARRIEELKEVEKVRV